MTAMAGSMVSKECEVREAERRPAGHQGAESLTDDGKLLEGRQQGHDMIGFVFRRIHFGCCVEWTGGCVSQDPGSGEVGGGWANWGMGT